MKEIDFVVQHKAQFLGYFRSKFPIFHNSNVFYRDLRYALKYFLISGSFRLSDAELEDVLVALIKVLVSDGTLKSISSGVWCLNYPEFRTAKPGKPSLKF